MQVWRSTKQTLSINQSHIQLSEFFRQSPLAELAATEELDLSRDKSLSPDRFIGKGYSSGKRFRSDRSSYCKSLVFIITVLLNPSIDFILLISRYRCFHNP